MYKQLTVKIGLYSQFYLLSFLLMLRLSDEGLQKFPQHLTNDLIRYQLISINYMMNSNMHMPREIEDKFAQSGEMILMCFIMMILSTIIFGW
jgi:hypothetical protein